MSPVVRVSDLKAAFNRAAAHLAEVAAEVQAGSKQSRVSALPYVSVQVLIDTVRKEFEERLVGLVKRVRYLFALRIVLAGQPSVMAGGVARDVVDITQLPSVPRMLLLLLNGGNGPGLTWQGLGPCNSGGPR